MASTASTIWKGHLTFGLVSIPVKLIRAARAEKIHMHQLQRDTGARVRQVLVPDHGRAQNDETPVVNETPALKMMTPAVTTPPAGPEEKNFEDKTFEHKTFEHKTFEKPGLQRADLVRGFEYEKDKYVEFEREELERLAPKNSSDMQIIEFVHFKEVDPVYLETSYYFVPDKGGEKPYALLFEALRKTGYAAIAEFVMHRRDQTIILRPGRYGIIGHTLFYEDEVRRENEFRVEASMVVPKEMELAVKLVDALAAPFEPEKFKDKYRERLEQAISQKREAGQVTESEPAARKAPVVDILAALKESLATTKKPPARESHPPAPAKKKRAGGK
jgi:DNA end-binding protein Ku